MVVAACCLASPEQQQSKKNPVKSLLGLLRRQVAKNKKKNVRARLPKARVKGQNGKKKTKASEKIPTRRLKKRTTAMQPITTFAPSGGGVGGLGILAGGAVAGSLLGGAIAASGGGNKNELVTTLAPDDAGQQTEGETPFTSSIQDVTLLYVATSETLPPSDVDVVPQTEPAPLSSETIA